MKIQDLQDGDLIFTVGSSEIAAAIRAATGSYNHVAIFFNGEIYHATHEKGVVNQDLFDFCRMRMFMTCTAIQLLKQMLFLKGPNYI